MPLYDFRCNGCADEFEQFASAMPDGNGDTYAEPSCPACGSPELTRLFKSVAIQTSAQRQGRVVDLSSGSCRHPGHGHGHGHGH